MYNSTTVLWMPFVWNLQIIFFQKPIFSATSCKQSIWLQKKRLPAIFVVPAFLSKAEV
jgi:hypothetical protein